MMCRGPRDREETGDRMTVRNLCGCAVLLIVTPLEVSVSLRLPSLAVVSHMTVSSLSKLDPVKLVPVPTLVPLMCQA